MITIHNFCQKYFPIRQNKQVRLFSLLSILLVVSSGCASQPSKSSKLKPSADALNSVNTPAPSALNATQLKLILDSPDTLRVKEGDTILKGQILVDRSTARQQIAARRKQIEQEARQLVPVEETPPPRQDTAVLDAQITQAREQVRLAELAFQDFQAQSPYTDAARQILSLPNEEEQIEQLQFAKLAAQTQLEQAIDERDAVKVAPPESQRPQTNFEGKKKQLLAELAAIENQLQSLQDILAPHNATVQKVVWQKQEDKGTPVELSLAIIPGTNPTSPLSSPPSDSIPRAPDNPATSVVPTTLPQVPAATNN